MDVLVTLQWCKKQKRGVILIEPNDNLSKEYLQTAEETLEVLRTISGKSKVWLATTKYYCEYFAVYSLFMKIGIKCEIHECSIEICKFLEKSGIIPAGFAKILEEDKQLRIDNQYYLKNRDVPIQYEKILEFVLKMKDITIKIGTDKIRKIREELEKN